MIEKTRLQELRKRKVYRREAELGDMEKEVGEYISPAEAKFEKRNLKPLLQEAKKARDIKKRLSEFKMKETLFIDEWHDTCEVLPDDNEDVWFIFDGQIKVGVYEPMQKVFCMADGFGAELCDVRQWKYVGVNKQFLKYPREHQIIACSVEGLPCLVTGIFTDHCVDENTYDEISAVILDDDYKGLGGAIDWKKISYWFELTEKPFVVLDPVEDSILAVFPDTQTVITDNTGVVLDPPTPCDSGNCVETPYKPIESSEISEDETEPQSIEDSKNISTSQIVQSKEEKDSEVSLQQEKVDDHVPVGDYIRNVNSTVKSALKNYTSNNVKFNTLEGRGIDKSNKTVDKAIHKYTSKKENRNMNKSCKVTEAQMDIVTDYNNLKGRVRDWYIKEYPTDELGQEISADITFQDVFDCLDRYQDVYSCLDVYDSVVRERVFTKLAELIDTDYDYIYDQWMLSNNSPFVRYGSDEDIKIPEDEDITEEQICDLANTLGLKDYDLVNFHNDSAEGRKKTLTELDALCKNFKDNLKNILNG